MTLERRPLARLSDEALLAATIELAERERHATAELIGVLTEVDRRRKCAATSHPRAVRDVAAGSRHIPAAVRREVWKRDAARCAFDGPHGRCDETGRLEFHHIVPYAEGGPATAGNIQLRCAAHNAYEATRYFADPESSLLRETAMPWTTGDWVQTESFLTRPPATP